MPDVQRTAQSRREINTLWWYFKLNSVPHEDCDSFRGWSRKDVCTSKSDLVKLLCSVQRVFDLVTSELWPKQLLFPIGKSTQQGRPEYSFLARLSSHLTLASLSQPIICLGLSLHSLIFSSLKSILRATPQPICNHFFRNSKERKRNLNGITSPACSRENLFCGAFLKPAQKLLRGFVFIYPFLSLPFPSLSGFLYSNAKYFPRH